MLTLILTGLLAATSGQVVFKVNKCAICHSIAGEGNKKGPLDGVGSRRPRAEIERWITDPVTMAAREGKDRKPAMKPYSLPKDELDALVGYLAGLK